MRFTKGHGTANDFVLLPDPDGDLSLTPAQVSGLCDRRRGIGADGVLRVVLTAAMPGFEDLADEARWFMDYRNADGGAVEMCGNGVRVFARYLADRGYAPSTSFGVATRDGVKAVSLRPDGSVAVGMGPPRFGAPFEFPDGATFVSMGNPHVVFFGSSLAAAPVASEGAALAASVPGGANVEYAVAYAPGELAMRVWERGVGETHSCGTGACAVAVAAALTGRSGRSSYVEVPGGRLHVAWRDDDEVVLTGPAVLVADGEVRDDWMEETT